jgi:hypothetical protein
MSSLLTRHVPPRAVAAVIAFAVLASLLGGRDKPNLALAHASQSARAPAPQAALDLDPANLKRPALQAGQAMPDLFAAPPPAAPPAAHVQAPAAPTAPPLPFRYVGRAVEEGRVAVFLEKGAENYSVAQGERAGRDYKVERVTEAAITFTYLPLGARQTLVVPTPN